ncbi:hypothetical protein JRQ81_012202 [Phrynocephalus forsythii]|uniref:Uncharacterized protein n=1 Tax=Phrynocephalus forsythii TaxID=171643 RepID=A0A9Q0X7F7_9SAUR|nr:hypothetical protein JRQ81_012202 [Phrynocephalus forsythii]
MVYRFPPAVERPLGADSGEVVLMLQMVEEANGCQGPPPAESSVPRDSGDGPSSGAVGGHGSSSFESDSAACAVGPAVPNPTVCLSPVVLLTPM